MQTNEKKKETEILSFTHPKTYNSREMIFFTGWMHLRFMVLFNFLGDTVDDCTHCVLNENTGATKKDHTRKARSVEEPLLTSVTTRRSDEFPHTPPFT